MPSGPLEALWSFWLRLLRPFRRSGREWRICKSRISHLEIGQERRSIWMCGKEWLDTFLLTFHTSTFDIHGHGLFQCKSPSQGSWSARSPETHCYLKYERNTIIFLRHCLSSFLWIFNKWSSINLKRHHYCKAKVHSLQKALSDEMLPKLSNSLTNDQ